ncbi:probable folate-biopterin transporter 4 [Ricinus communis]|uniref:Transporter, putative n=1 Tax=Ricinus communis TaxID=3988 RepID=B9SAF5_RICCO|nr:probable folate-biopterin transporter 4 [Ricinus communis]EEF39404.1 transporter, putative [Ricinus communis]|eukprot:XP_002522974.1 probable folate-biopterin transporter 4 [Ricinus communis]
MIGWIKQLRRSFGASFLWLICLIYFTQGFRSFVWTAVSYHLKDRLKLSPSASQFVSSVAFFPWSIKPLYGIVSDCIPIKGRKRIPYLVIATVLSLVPWPVLGLKSTLRSSRWHLIILLTVQNLGSAMADVVVDAMIAEAVRFERASFAGDLQSISWLSMAVGGVCGSLFGGYALTSLQIDTIFLLFSVLPAIQLLSCGFVEENSVGSKVLPEFASSTSSSHLENGNGVLLDEDSFLAKKSNRSTSRRKRSQKNNIKRIDISSNSHNLEKGNSLALGWLHSLKAASYSLLHAFRQPIILRPMAWFFLAHVTMPNLSTVMFYYQTEALNLDASFLGTARVVGWLGLMLGTFTYNHQLKRMKLRKILLCAQIGLSLMSLLDMVLVSRMSLAYGISDKIMVLCGSALADAINQFKFMPFLILSGQLCPPGIEGTLFALFMSINNLGSTLGSFTGAGLASFLNLSSGSFDNLVLGIAIQVLCTYIPVALLFLIPKEATGISA